MPLDGSEYEVRNHVLDQIDRVIALLATEDKWCKRVLESADGRRCILSLGSINCAPRISP